MSVPEKNNTVLTVAFLVAIITATVYLPALKNGFVTWDDNEYVYNNLKITRLDADFFRWAFTSRLLGMYAPLTTVSLGIDYSFWNLSPSGYHLTNVALHAINTFLVVLCIAQIFQVAAEKGYLGSFSRVKMLITAGVTGLLFGVHPLHVESVAWVTERKDLLYTFFFLLSILAYVRYATDKGRRWLYYWLAAATFVLSMLSKPMAVTLPAVLILLDVYPLNRFSTVKGPASIKQLFLEKLPFFGLSLIFSVVTIFPLLAAILARETVTTVSLERNYSLFERMLTSGRALVFYLRKLVLPTDLSPLYPLILPVSFTGGDVIVFSVLSGITILCFLGWRKNRVWMIAWLYYIISVLPVSGILIVGPHAAADRYTYMPLIGPMALVGGGVAYAAVSITAHYSAHRIVSKLFLAGLSGLFVVMAVLTIQQIGVWKDPITLWNRVIGFYPDSTPVPYTGRAEAFYGAGDFGRAIADYTEAIKLNPIDYHSYVSRGIVYFMSGQKDLALSDFNTALRIEPGDGRAIYNRGLLCRGMESQLPACK